MMAKPLKLTFATAICLKENPGALHLSVGFTEKIMLQIPEVAFVRIYFNKKNIVWTRNSNHNITPSRADIFGIYFPNKKRIAHTGFIDKWTSTQVHTVEGNTNQAGSREGDGVYRKIRLTRQIYAVARFIK